MSANSKIEWTDHTFNPWIGCTKVSLACDGCYAEVSTPARALRVGWGAGQPRHRTSPANWALPLRWNARAQAFAAQHGRRQRVFCASLADWLDNEVDVAWLADLLQLVRITRDLDWLLLSKRIGNWRKRIEEVLRYLVAQPEINTSLAGWLYAWLDGSSAPRNVRLGATIESQKRADEDIPKLLSVSARVHFLSMEPLLGAVTVRPHWLIHHHPGDAAIDWVIVGGESGPQARPMHPDWARSLRNQCAAAGVPFLFKQWGEWKPISQMDESEHGPIYKSRVIAKPHEDQSNLDDIYGKTCTVPFSVVHLDGSLHDVTEPNAFINGAMQTFKVGKKAAGRQLDGVQHDGYPS